MYNTILIAVGRNTRARGIVHHAQQLGEPGQTRLVLLHVAPLLEKTISGSGRLIDPGERMVRLESEIRAELERLARRPRWTSFSVETAVRFGDAAEEIARVADQWAAQLIVMGAPQHRRWFPGTSLADRLLKGTSRAVVLVRPDLSSEAA